jgi:hypothetical protein
MLGHVLMQMFQQLSLDSQWIIFVTRRRLSEMLQGNVNQVAKLVRSHLAGCVIERSQLQDVSEIKPIGTNQVVAKGRHAHRGDFS